MLNWLTGLLLAESFRQDSIRHRYIFAYQNGGRDAEVSWNLAVV